MEREGRKKFFDFSEPGKFAFILILPAQILLFFIILFPLACEIYLSLTSWSPTRGGNWWNAHQFWQWFQNYWELFHDINFINAILRTFLIVVIAVPIEFFLGMGLAFLFLENFPGKRIFHSIILMPMMIVPAVAGYMFYMLFQSTGPLNYILSKLFFREITYTWLNNQFTALLAIMIVDIWEWTPLMFLILLAGLVSLPENQMKAATILGASPWQKLTMLTLPMMKPIIIIAFIIRGMEAVKIFDPIFLLTSGGPGRATESISVYMYKEAFFNLRWSYMAGAGILILILMSILTMFALKPLREKEAVEGKKVSLS